MADKQQAISYLTQLKREMGLQRDRLLRPVHAIEKKLESISAVLAVLLEETKEEISPQAGIDDFPVAKLKRLSHRQAVIEIARHNGGTVKAQDAKRILIHSGCMSNTKNSTNMTHNAIVQSGAFERVGKGEYRLKSASKTEDGREFYVSPVQ